VATYKDGLTSQKKNMRNGAFSEGVLQHGIIADGLDTLSASRDTREAVMEHYVGLDVSQRITHACVIDAEVHIIWHSPSPKRYRVSPRLYRRTLDSSGRAFPLYPGTSDLNLFGSFKRIVYFNTGISYCAFDLGVPEQQLYRSKIAGTLVDQGRFGASDRMGAIDGLIKPNRCKPLTKQSGILPCGQMCILSSASWEQVLTGCPGTMFEIGIDGLSRLFCDFELDRLASFLLTDNGAVNGIAARCHILHSNGHDIAAPKLAVYG